MLTFQTELRTRTRVNLIHLSTRRYLSLDPNERSNWKARELKSVFVEARAQFLKFSIFKNHINAINLFNQVCAVRCMQIIRNEMNVVF
jgi:hypothetical protein